MYVLPSKRWEWGKFLLQSPIAKQRQGMTREGNFSTAGSAEEVQKIPYSYPPWSKIGKEKED